MVDLQRLHDDIEYFGKDTFTKEEVIAVLTGVMEWRLQYSAQEEHFAAQETDPEERDGRVDRSNMMYDEADGIRYALMAFGMELDEALDLRDKLHNEALALAAKGE